MNDDEINVDAGIFPVSMSDIEKRRAIEAALTPGGLIELLTAMIEPLRRGEWYSVVDDIEGTIVPTLKIVMAKKETT